MKAPDYPDNEKARVQVLAEYGILDTPSEEAFDNLTKLVADLLEVPFALVSLVDAKRQWFKSRYGLDATETSREISFCGHVVESGLPLIVENTLKDERFFDNPLVIDHPGIRFYAGYPLSTPQGLVLGAICAIDTKERKAGSREIEILSIMANQTMKLLELHRANVKIEEEHARLEAILETNVDAIISIDEKGIIEMANPSALKVLGYQSEEMLGKNASMIVPNPNKKKHDHHIQRYLETGKKKMIGCGREAHAQKKDGTLLPVELSLSEVRFGDRRHFTAIIRDITDRYSAQQKINSTLAELEKSEEYLHQVLNQLQV
ncbi:MAG: PAS domain S-box protein, partial [Planctomycetota bacterium]